MSKYTTEIRFICESSIPLKEQGNYHTIDEAIQYGRQKIFDFPYELFDNDYKGIIETKFLRHYYTREIGFETVGLFKHMLHDRLEMVLPYYNQLWESALLKFNPFDDVDYWVKDDGIDTRDDKNVRTGGFDKTDTIREIDGIKNRVLEKSGKERVDYYDRRNEDLFDKYSDTPQGELNGVIDTDWLTNARQNDNLIISDGWSERTPQALKETLNGTSSHDGDNSYITTFKDLQDKFDGKLIKDYTKHVAGKMNPKSYSELLIKYRETFINIDKRFIDEFKKLFMLIY